MIQTFRQPEVETPILVDVGVVTNMGEDVGVKFDHSGLVMGVVSSSSPG